MKNCTRNPTPAFSPPRRKGENSRSEGNRSGLRKQEERREQRGENRSSRFKIAACIKRSTKQSSLWKQNKEQTRPIPEVVFPLEGKKKQKTNLQTVGEAEGSIESPKQKKQRHHSTSSSPSENRPFQNQKKKREPLSQWTLAATDDGLSFCCCWDRHQHTATPLPTVRRVVADVAGSDCRVPPVQSWKGSAAVV